MAASKDADTQIFQPFRALGYVTNDIPFALQTRGSEHFVTTCLGNSFHTYNCARLNLLFVGPALKDTIQCLATYGDLLFTACGCEIVSWRRGKQVDVYEGYSASVQQMMCFGTHLLAVTADNVFNVRTIEGGEVYSSLPFSPEHFLITAMLHPATYLNKILLGSRQGTLQLWNLRTSKLVYEFKGFNSGVTALSQSPAIDVVGIGLEAGNVIVFNLKYNATVMTFRQDWGPIGALSFCTDDQPMLVTSAGGRLSVWNLEERKLTASVAEAHHGQVTSVQFLQSQPLLLTSGTDNALKLWIFDQSDGHPRLLRSRSGHSAPPMFIRHCGSSGRDILSAGLDRDLRHFSTIQDQQNIALSQGHISSKSKRLGVAVDELKLPPITTFAYEELRQADWDCVITAHLNTLEVYTWSYENKAKGKHTLVPPRPLEGVVAKAVAMSPCGNFAVVGLSNGEVDRYNIQSGLHRGSYGQPRAHRTAVRGIATDATNEIMVTGGADHCVKFWNFSTHQKLGAVDTGAPISSLLLHRESNLLAVIGDDFSVGVYDIDTRRLVRSFTGHTNRITDAAFSSDSRWLVTASMDSTVRVWDVVTGLLLDWFRVEMAVTSLSLSPTMDFLATAHVDRVGICLWANRVQFLNAAITPAANKRTPRLLAMPSVAPLEVEETEGEGDAEMDSRTDTDMDLDNAAILSYKTPDQLSEELVTLSHVPSSYWKTLANLDLIKERNKPKEAPQAPESAPFFLPTTPGIVPKFVVDDKADSKDRANDSHLVSLSAIGSMSRFSKALLDGSADNDYSQALDMLKSMSPAAVDVEVRSLSAANDYQDHKAFLSLLCAEVDKKTNFDLVQAYLRLYLTVHSEVAAENDGVGQQLNILAEKHEQTWGQLSQLLNYTLCMIGFIKNQ